MWAALSNSVTPSRVMRPSSGVRMPATHRSVTLLPQPEAPSRANVSRSASNWTSR